MSTLDRIVDATLVTLPAALGLLEIGVRHMLGEKQIDMLYLPLGLPVGFAMAGAIAQIADAAADNDFPSYTMSCMINMGLSSLGCVGIMALNYLSNAYLVK